jgi:Muconolactone delta-isomerase
MRKKIFLPVNKEGEPMKYLVVGSGGPGFSSPEEAVQVLENIVLPSFEAFMKLEAEKKIIAGGLPVGERAFVFIMEASSNEEVDRLLREIPMWGLLEWEVTALQTLEGRASQEREFVRHERDFAKKKKSR